LINTIYYTSSLTIFAGTEIFSRYSHGLPSPQAQARLPRVRLCNYPSPCRLG
jgi:hypothetical protein